MNYVAINTDFGHFELTDEVMEMLAERKGVSVKEIGSWKYGYCPRHDEDLIEIIRELGGSVNDVELKEISGDKYIIDDYDGNESVLEPKDIKWVDIVKAEKADESKETYYQPSLYFDDGINIDWGLPQELNSFEVFRTEEECKEWLEENGYDVKNCVINEYEDDDIEEHVYVE